MCSSLLEVGPFVSWRAQGVSVKIYKNKDANGNYADELDPDEAVSSSQELYGVTITKRDSSGGTVLKGARFSLYQVDLDASIAQGKVVAKLDDGCGDNPAYSSDSGVVTFGTSEHPLESSVLYYFVEDSAPAGYEVTNTDPTYVMFCGTGEQAEKDYREAFAKANSLGIKPSAGASFSVFDKKSDTDVTEPRGEAPLTVAKRVNGNAPEEDQSFQFGLSAETEGAPMPKTGEGTVATTTGADAARFGDIEFSLADAGAIYEYRIHELTEAGAGWTNAPDVIATVTVGTRDAEGVLPLHGDVSRRRGRSRVLYGRRQVRQHVRGGSRHGFAYGCQDG